MVLTPEFLWAQRKDRLFLTVNVPNVDKKNAITKLTDDGHVYFKGKGGDVRHTHEYELDIRLLKPIKASSSQCNIGARGVQFRIEKAESGPFWGQLLKEKKNLHCKVDWDHWRDEDEEDDYNFGVNWDSKDMADLDFGDDQDESSDSDEEALFEDQKENGSAEKGTAGKEGAGKGSETNGSGGKEGAAKSEDSTKDADRKEAK